MLSAAVAQAQLSVALSPVKITGQKAVVPLALKNNLSEKIESARAVVFLLDEQGKAIGQPTTRWIIDGSKGGGLTAGGTNVLNFVITGDKPFATTNITPKISFARIVLESGRLADPIKDVAVTQKK